MCHENEPKKDTFIVLRPILFKLAGKTYIRHQYHSDDEATVLVALSSTFSCPAVSLVNMESHPAALEAHPGTPEAEAAVAEADLRIIETHLVERLTGPIYISYQATLKIMKTHLGSVEAHPMSYVG